MAAQPGRLCRRRGTDACCYVLGVVAGGKSAPSGRSCNRSPEELGQDRSRQVGGKRVKGCAAGWADKDAENRVQRGRETASVDMGARARAGKQPCRSFGLSRGVLIGVAVDERERQRGKCGREKHGLVPQDDVGAVFCGADAVDGEFDYAGGGLAVEKDECTSHSQLQREAVIVQTTPQQRPPFVVTEDVLGEALAAQPTNLQIRTETASVRPFQEVPHPATSGCARSDPGVHVVLSGVGEGAVILLEKGQEVGGSFDPRPGVFGGARGDPQPSCSVSRAR